MSDHFTAPAARRKEQPAKRKTRKSPKNNRPSKPESKKDFPLYAHPLGYWSKKIAGKIVHFGRWGRIQNKKMVQLPYEESWQAALATYNARKQDAIAGKIDGCVVDAADHPDNGSEELLVKELCNRFLSEKRKQLNKPKGKKIGPRMFGEYKDITDMLCAQFGKDTPVSKLRPKDFAALREYMESRWGLHRLKNSITRVKTVFKDAYEFEWIPAPIPCLQAHGRLFAPPSEDQVRQAKNEHELEHGQNILTAAECRKLIDNTTIPLKAMILLGLNCGFGNHDCAMLPVALLQLDEGWINYPRPKNGIQRRCPLWPETVEALRDALAARPKPKSDDDAKFVFLMPSGGPWLCRGIANPITVAAGKAMRAAKVHRKGLGFYTLRHTFRTEADATLDFPAVRLIMGHADPNKIDAIYRLKIAPERLLNVTNHVHQWLFGTEGGAQ